MIKVFLRMVPLVTAALAATAVLMPSSVFAHHAMEVHYLVEEEAIVSKEGIVKNFSLMDPHSYLVVTVEENGESDDWVLEGRSRVMLTRAGWRFDMFKAGSLIKFSAFPARNGDSAGRILILEVGGQVYCSDRCDLFDIDPIEISESRAPLVELAVSD